jgi:hypothetical protein
MEDTMTDFMRFWKALNAELARLGEEETGLADARTLFELFGDAADSAADHERRVRRT